LGRPFFANPVMQNTVWLFGVLLLVCVVGQGPDWGSLTADELSKIAPDVFETVTAADIAEIPSIACSGFQKAQLLVLNVDAVRSWFLVFFSLSGCGLQI
jgi:hypothetical protein